MQIVVVGPGALGCLISALLTRNLPEGDQLFLLDHRPQRATLLGHQGLLCQEAKNSWRVWPAVLADANEIPGQTDTLLLCVKSYAVQETLTRCQALLHPNLLVVLLQNGIGHLDAKSWAEPATVAFASTTEGAHLPGPGQVVHAGHGQTQLGFLSPAEPDLQQRLAALAERFSACGLPAAISSDIRQQLWTKLLINVAINGLTAIHDCPNGQLLTLPGVPQRMAALVEEASQVAAAAGVVVPADSYQRAIAVCQSTAANISSMLQDLRAGRRTEIAAINGAIVRLGEQLGLPVTANRQLTEEVLARESHSLLTRTNAGKA